MAEFVPLKDIIKDRDFYKSKVEELTTRVRVLEFENAQLVRRDDELVKRLAAVASKKVRKERIVN